MDAWHYILRCADGPYYAGTPGAELEQRIVETRDVPYHELWFPT